MKKVLDRYPKATRSLLDALKKINRLEEIARGGIERNLGDVYEDYPNEQDAADAMYDEAFTLAFDALVDAGVPFNEARQVAARVAQCYAQP